MKEGCNKSLSLYVESSADYRIHTSIYLFVPELWRVMEEDSGGGPLPKQFLYATAQARSLMPDSFPLKVLSPC